MTHPEPPGAVVPGVVFPAASPRSGPAWAVTLAVLTALLVVLSVAKLQAPLIGLVGVGLPLLFALHLRSAAVPRSRAAFVAALGTVAGIAWAIADDAVAANIGPDALGTPVRTTWLPATSLALRLVFVGLLALLAVIARPRQDRRRPVQGCLIGALGGYALTAASTFTELVSQFDDGLAADGNRTAATLAAAAVIQGLAVPLTAAWFGGAVGAAAWTVSPAGAARRHPHVSSPVVPIAGGVVIYLAVGLLDLSTWSYGVSLVIHALIAVLALTGQRVVLRDALRRTPRLEVAANRSHSESRSRTIGLAGVGLLLAMVSTTVVALLATPPAPRYVCPPDCGHPPLRRPVATNPRYTPAGGQFSVSYPGEGSAYTAAFQPDGVVLTLLAEEGGTLRLSGEPAAGRTARRVVQDVITDVHPDARVDYEIPNALVGYRLGYGVVADVYPVASIGDDSRLRLLVMAAVKDDFALVAAGAGPFREFGPDFGSGHPSGANFLLALDMGKYVNSFTWRGDPPR